MGKPAIIKTRETNASIGDFIASLTSEQQRDDSRLLIELMKKHTGEMPKLWGSSIIGFGNKRYQSPKTGREVDWFLIGFSPRKAALSIYLQCDLKKFETRLEKLGRHKTGVGCLYIKKLEDVNIDELEKLIKASL
ncbi:hypothetical protein GCM10027051_35410 [Niabella terrae]